MKYLLVAGAQLLFTLALYFLGVLIVGTAAFPGAVLWLWVWGKAAALSFSLRVLAVCFGFAAAYFLYGLSLIFVVGALRILFRLNLKEGSYPMVCAETARWALTNALYLLVTATFMDFILLTPWAALFFRLMGAKLGKNVQINSKFCADLPLLEIGDNSVIGGHATVIGHSFERDRLILKKVKIGRNVVIGLNSIVLPGAEIGDGALVAAAAIVPKGTSVPPGTTYFGK